jgi:hypothetical protein
MKKISRITIHEEQIIDLDGDIDSAISQLQSYKEKGWDRVRCTTISYQYDAGKYPVILVYRNRMETDEEYEKRIAKEKQLKIKQQELDLKEYSRLKKLFENQ